MPELELAGEVAVVTGAAQGIGAAIARRFARAGAQVALADVQVSMAEAVATELRSDGHDAAAFAVDIADHDSVVALRAAVVDRYGPAGVLVNNAALIPFRPFLDMTREEWDRTIATNVNGTYSCSRVFCADMIERATGSIVVISSVNGIRAQRGLSAYNVTKAALIMFAQTLALELAPAGVRVNAIAPGDIATGVADHVPDQEAADANIPLGRYGLADEVAEAALFLASSRASYTTGSVLAVDGGLGAQLYPSDLVLDATEPFG